MSAPKTAVERARAIQRTLDNRTSGSRLGRSMYREADLDILAMREASRAIQQLIEELER